MTINKYDDYIKNVEVPSWDEYFLNIAELVKIRSKDANTKHGCVLVDEKNRIVGTGYNSFPSSFPDWQLPNARKDKVDPTCPKYHFMVHSEENAICNLTTKNYDYLTCYITGTPCVRCLRLLIQAGVKRIVMSNKYGWQHSGDEQTAFNEMINCSWISIETIKEKYELFVIDNIIEYRWINK